MEAFLFYLLGGVALIAAINMIAVRRVFYAAISLIVCLCCLAGLYLLLQAPFLAAIQIIVYAGAIMVLFLFVIMLLDPFSNAVPADKKKSLRVLALVLGTLILVLLFPLLRAYDISMAPRSPEAIEGGWGAVRTLADSLFNQYLLPFEVTSILILVAIIGAVVLAKRQT